MIDKINNNKILWLALNLFMVLSMVVIGGITRLTDSGLSMTNWHLIKGIVPPLSENDWIKLFEIYKEYPEYQLKNITMTVNEFKKIFFWEYLHRVWGRLIGLTFLLPLLYFWIRGWFSKSEKKLLLILTLLGLFQAFMGWYMVKSGLIDKPDVSHFRLSAHLLTAFLIYSLLLYFFWDIYSKEKSTNHSTKVIKLKWHKNNFVISLFLVLFTISAGALVSGTEAGLAYNNFPLMGDNFLPPILIYNEELSLESILNDQGFLQFLHRFLATITLLFVLHTIFSAYKNHFYDNFKKLFYFLFFMIIFQYSLGVMVLKFYVPFSLGIMHQLGSLLLLSLIIISICEAKKMGRYNAPNLIKD